MMTNPCLSAHFINRVIKQIYSEPGVEDSGVPDDDTSVYISRTEQIEFHYLVNDTLASIS